MRAAGHLSQKTFLEQSFIEYNFKTFLLDIGKFLIFKVKNTAFYSKR